MENLSASAVASITLDSLTLDGSSLCAVNARLDEIANASREKRFRNGWKRIKNALYARSYMNTT